MISKFKLAKLKLKLSKYATVITSAKTTKIVVATSAAATMISFQNCSKTHFTAVEDNSSLKISSVKCINPFTGEELLEGQGFTAWNRPLIPVGDSALCLSETRVCVSGEFTGTYEHPNCVKETPGNCVLNGIRNGVSETVSVLHGQSVDVFESDRVAYGLSCDGIKHTRTCNNGVLSGPNYVQLACAPTPGASCNNVIFRRNGVDQTPRTLAHNEEVVGLFANYSLPYGQSCGSGQALRCVNGQLSGTSNRELQCATQGPPPANCENVILRLDGVAQAPITINHGQAVNGLFLNYSLPHGQSCGSGQTLTCSNGVLSGTVNREIRCTEQPAPPANCTNVVLRHNGIAQPPITINHGQSVPNLYVNYSVGFGGSCGTGETLTCANGVLSGTNNREVLCTPANPRNCENVVLRRKGVAQPAITINHGQSVQNLFLNFSVAHNQSCGASQTLTCSDGTLSGTNNRELECEVQPPPPADCTNVVLRRNGVDQPPITIPHGQSAQNLYANFSVPHNQSCGTGQDLMCNNGQLSGTNNREILCTQQPAPPRDCTVRLKYDGVNEAQDTIIPHGGTSQGLFLTHSVPFSGSCGSTGTLSCNDGILSGTANREKRCQNQAATFDAINTEGVTGSTPGDPVKLFMIVDFSPSMAEEIAKVKLALRAFMENNTQAFNIYLFNIDHPTVSRAIPMTSNYEYVLADPAVPRFELRSNTTAVQKDAFIAALEAYRLSYIANLDPNNSNVIEKGICQVVRLLKDSRYITSSDKVSFLTVTDEDDGSMSNCLSGRTTEITPGYRQLPVTVTFPDATPYRYGHATFLASGLQQQCTYPDGQPPVCTEVAVTGVSIGLQVSCGLGSVFQSRCDSLALNTAHACTAAEVSHLQSQLYSQGFSSGATITNCNLSIYESSSNTTQTYYLNENLTNKTLEEIISGELFTYDGGSQQMSLEQWVQSQVGSGTVHNLSGVGQIQTVPSMPNTYTTYHQEVAGYQSYDNAIDALIRQKIDSAAGGKVAMNFVVFQGYGQCTAGETGIPGYTYMSFASAMSTKPGNALLYKHESICQASYDGSLLLTQGLAVWTPTRDYTLTGQNALNVNGVAAIRILRANGSLVVQLAPGQYSINMTTKILNIPSPIEIPQGGSIILLPASQ